MFLLALLLALPGAAEENGALAIQRIESDLADRIQSGVLDPILGRGKATAFVRVAIVFNQTSRQSERRGEGGALKFAMKPTTWEGVDDLFFGELRPEFKLDGLSSDQSVSASTTDAKGKHPTSLMSQQKQTSRQIKGDSEDRVTLRREFSDFRVVILHDAQLPLAKMKSVQTALIAVYSPELKSDNIILHRIDFNEAR